MKTVQLFLPDNSNSGKSTATAHKAFQNSILLEFEGFTQHFAVGTWQCKGKVYREPVTVYTVSSNAPSLEASCKLYAEWFAARTGQKCIYWIKSNGEAEIFETVQIDA